MSQTTHRVIDVGNNPDGYPDRPQSIQNPPPQGESNFGDSSAPFFSLYSKIAEDEDNKMVDRWQKDADGILIFTGLFSAAVAALLAITVQDLRPNSQDISAFYLGNIYGVLADPNATRPSIPSPVTPPPFSPPRYTVWVNSLWFLSLVMSLSCALWATSFHQWARRYVRLTQPARCSPEKRARMRAFFANGVDKMHVPWAVEGLPTLLHLSLFLFFGGLGIFLFNVDQEVFTFVVSWIGLFSVVYGLITLLPLIQHDSPYNTPLSLPTWFLCTRIPHVAIHLFTATISLIIAYILVPIYLLAIIIFRVLFFFTTNHWQLANQIQRYWERFWRYSNQIAKYLSYWIWRTERPWSSSLLKGLEKKTEETASKRPSKTDARIFGWTISALGDDDSLETFFETIPGLFNSNLVKNVESDITWTDLKKFWGALDGFMRRTLSSNSVTESVKSRRVLICRDVIGIIPCPDISIYDDLRSHFDQEPVSIARLQSMRQWFTHKDHNIADYARVEVARSLASMQERDEAWIALASDMCGLTADDLRDDIAHGGDNVLFATLIHLSRRVIHHYHPIRHYDVRPVEAVTKFDIRHTLPRLQNDFCKLWNEFAQESRVQGYPGNIPVSILRLIRHLYIALHQGTHAAPFVFSSSTDDSDNILRLPFSYPSCDIASHHSGSTAYVPVPISTHPGNSPDASPYYITSGGSAVSESSTIAGPPEPSHPTTPNEIGDSSWVPAATEVTERTLTVHTSPRLTDASPPHTVAAAPRNIPQASTFSYPPEGTTQREIVTPRTELDICEVLSIASAPATPVPVSKSTPPVLNESMASCDASAASTSNLLLPVLPAVGSSIPVSSPSCVPPLPNAEFLDVLDSTTPSHPAGNTTLPHLRALGLVSIRGMSVANALWQLLVHSPPFRKLFREMGDLEGRRAAGGPEIGGGETPLVDALMRFSEEFVFKEKEPPPTQQLVHQTEMEKPREDEEGKKENKVVDSFEPTYMYDAMKGKRKLKEFLDGKHQDAEEFLGLYLDELDEELAELHTYISTHKPTSIPSVEKLGEGSEETQPAGGQTELGKRDYTAGSVESPISRIFGGRSRSTVRVPSQPDTVTTEAWRSLKLHIQHDSVHTIQDALAHISQPQPVPVSQSSSNDASQEILLDVLPPVLVLHLERFLCDVTADGIVKISKPIEFSPELEIPLEIVAPVSGESTEPVHYKLYGVLYHHGESAGSGHFTVDVLHPNEDRSGGEGWLRIDDEAVRAVRHEDVFGAHDNEQVDDRSAYMLFYCRTAFTGT